MTILELLRINLFNAINLNNKCLLNLNKHVLNIYANIISLMIEFIKCLLIIYALLSN